MKKVVILSCCSLFLSGCLGDLKSDTQKNMIGTAAGALVGYGITYLISQKISAAVVGGATAGLAGYLLADKSNQEKISNAAKTITKKVTEKFN